MYIYSGNEHSSGARELAAALGINRIRHRGSRFVAGPNKVLINWGAGSDTFPHHLLGCRILNRPAAVTVAANKRAFFELNDRSDHPASTPEWTTQRTVAERWVARGDIVVARRSLTGHSGHGIVIVESENQMVDAPLYTKYRRKTSEFRVHVVAGQIIDIQKKVAPQGTTPTSWQVRSHDNGFIFIREGFNVPNSVREQALRAYQGSGLHFGAVDVIWHESTNASVLEINTAPGLEGQTIRNYAEAFRAGN